MTLPYSDPSNPALPSPLFSDVTAVRADHMRANNAAIFADLDFLDTNNPALVALTGGSFKTSALANADTYNGRSLFTCTAGVSDTPYSGAWRILGIWNPTDSSGRFTAMLDTTLETWEINYSGGAWGTWTKHTDSYGNRFANAFVGGYNTTATSGGTLTLDVSSAPNQFFTGVLNHTVVLPVVSTLQQGRTFFIANAGTGTIRVNSSGGNLVAYIPPSTTPQFLCILTSGTSAASWFVASTGPDATELFTRSQGGQWFDTFWKSADEITLLPKYAQGLGYFIGAVLNDNTYLKLDSAYTIKLDTPANGGQILDGITAKLPNAWYNIWAYKDSAGALAAGLTWAPVTTFSNANPTDSLTLAQVNSQDIGFLFPVDGKLVCWQDGDEWETPIAWQNAGAVTYSPSKDKPKIASRNATTLTLGASLENNNFTAGSTVYQVAGFKPLQVSDGAIAAVIGSNPYRDTGIRFRTEGSGNIIQFNVAGNEFRWVNGTGAADLTVGYNVQAMTTSWATYLDTYTPPDKTRVIMRTSIVDSVTYYKPYWTTYGEQTTDDSAAGLKLDLYLQIRHRMYGGKCTPSTGKYGNMGYII